jgi:hypothetical protein
MSDVAIVNIVTAAIAILCAFFGPAIRGRHSFFSHSVPELLLDLGHGASLVPFALLAAGAVSSGALDLLARTSPIYLLFGGVAGLAHVIAGLRSGLDPRT